MTLTERPAAASARTCRMTGGHAVAATLSALGVRAAFGIPGVHNLGIYDGLVDHPEIRHVVARHEQGAAFMADGYARVTGRTAAVLVTTGPGGPGGRAAAGRGAPGAVRRRRPDCERRQRGAAGGGRGAECAGADQRQREGCDRRNPPARDGLHLGTVLDAAQRRDALRAAG